MDRKIYFLILTTALGFFAGSGGFFWAKDYSIELGLTLALIIAVMVTNVLNSYETNRMEVK